VNEKILKEFLTWGAKHKGFPYSQVSYWIDAYIRHDGKDVYGHEIEKVSYAR
jgi:hypothetical protein